MLSIAIFCPLSGNVLLFDQKTADAVRISDCSSDVCYSDLPAGRGAAGQWPMATATAMTRWRHLLVVLGWMTIIAPAGAQDVPPPAYQIAAHRAGIPSAVLYAVALQERGLQRDGRLVPWPWTLNVAGVSRRFSSRAKACTGLQKALREAPPTRVDAGLGPVNLGYQNTG